MLEIKIRTMQPEDIPQIIALQERYAQANPGADIKPGGVYLSPGFHEGQDVFCALDARGQLLGYAPVYANLVASPPDAVHQIWIEVKADPGLKNAESLKDQLFAWVVSRAQVLAQAVPGHPARLIFQYFPFETGSLQYAQARGFQYTESVFQMSRDLRTEIPTVMKPAGIRVQPWRMDSQVEQQAYLAARNQAFPEAPCLLDEWQYFLNSPLWNTGTTITAFDGDQVVGSVTLFEIPAESQAAGKKIGFTEYIFVRPAWQKRGIGRYLVREGLVYLQAHGFDQAHLEVRAKNKQALGLYLGLGFQVERESLLYEKAL